MNLGWGLVEARGRSSPSPMFVVYIHDLYVNVCSCCSSLGWDLSNVGEFPVIWMNVGYVCLCSSCIRVPVFM